MSEYVVQREGVPLVTDELRALHNYLTKASIEIESAQRVIGEMSIPFGRAWTGNEVLRKIAETDVALDSAIDFLEKHGNTLSSTA